jgi:hypothetical protein
MRKAFNFFHSYYEVAKELNDKDRLAFLDAILKKQFTGCETELTGMSKFAYLSQKHSIDSQIKGYFDKTKDPMFDPLQDPCQGGSVDPIKAPSVQEKEKEQEKEQDVYTHPLQKFILDNLPTVSKLEIQLTNEQCEKLIGEFNKDSIKDILESMENSKQLTKKYKSVNLTIRSWIKTRQQNNPMFGKIETYLPNQSKGISYFDQTK